MLLKIPGRPESIRDESSGGSDNLTSTIRSVVYPSELLDHDVDEVVDFLLLEDVRALHVDFDVAVGSSFSYQLSSDFQSILILVGYSDFLAAFTSERDCCCLADTFVRLKCILVAPISLQEDSPHQMQPPSLEQRQDTETL